jgi:hypothetical protein
VRAFSGPIEQMNNGVVNYNNINQNIYNYNNKISINIRYNDDEVTIIDLPDSGSQNVPIEIEIPTNSRLFQRSTNPHIKRSSNDLLQVVENFNEDEEEIYNEKPIDVPEGFEKDTYQVLNLQEKKNQRHFKRRICTPTRNLNAKNKKVIFIILGNPVKFGLSCLKM